MENNSGDENSDDGLQIVLESPRPKKRNKKELDEADRKIIECVEKDIEDNLEKKAAKAKLTTTNVKTILKEVVTNEHVLALVRHAENPTESDEPITVYEPKYTRAKTKELLSTNVQPNKILPWATPIKPVVSEVQKLFSEELQEDSSGDEYVPDSPNKNSSFEESMLDTSQGTLRDEEPNIALRTRSKFSLNNTPLEVIEEAFMPPDITTDMYDMDCDDDVWKEFLKTFTRPLDEVTKITEDEDHDPEYNVLADEEIDEVDKEELRADRAVTVSRKELNCLIAELFEFADIYESNKQNEKNVTSESSEATTERPVKEKTLEVDFENDPNICIRKCQIPILAQQMREHVQMLAQNFLLSYEHPEFADMADKLKDMLEELDRGSKGKTVSMYHVINLKSALKLIEDWQHLFETKDKEALECKKYVEKVLVESTQAKRAGSEYVVTFPLFLMKTIANSEVFMCPYLLPRIPLRSVQVTRTRYYFFTGGEESLIALFLEQAIPWMKQDPWHLNRLKRVNMDHVGHFIHTLLIPSVSPVKILRHIKCRRQQSSEENPIKYYYRNKKAPPTVHYVAPINANSMLPPSKRSSDQLPFLWRQYIYPNEKKEKNVCTSNVNNPTVIVSTPQHLRLVTNLNYLTSYNANFAKKIIANRKIQPKGVVVPVINYTKRRKTSGIRTKFPRNICNKENRSQLSTPGSSNQTQSDMLPDMPSLGHTPMKKQNVESEMNRVKEKEPDTSGSEEQLSFKNITNFDIQLFKPESVTQARRNFESITQFSSPIIAQQDPGASTSVNSSNSTEKDNPDDINELMIASCTVKNVTKKEPSGAEKKRAKMRREFVANLVMATPEDPETENQKDESFADAFFDKLRETLTSEDYEKLMNILGHYDEHNGEFLDLFKNVQSVLYPAYKELAEEFLLFLTEIQAHKVGQLMPYFVMKDMDRFIKKLQIFFKDQPSQMKKIIKSFTELSENADVTMETIKNSILPLFKGNAALRDWFLQLFSIERPPQLLTSMPHEVVDISKELARQPDENIFETVILPDTEDPYGGPTCICPCHNVEDQQYQSRSQHCNKCGLKFIQGKVYIQRGKALRPAVVSFLTNPEKDHSKRLAASQRKRSETSPSKQMSSPSKDNQVHEEPRHSNESDDDGDGGKKKRRSKSQRKRKIKNRDKSNSAKDTLKSNSNKETSSKCDKTKSDSLKPTKAKRQSKKKSAVANKTPEHKPGSTLGQQKRPAEEQEIEYTEPAEYVDLKVSSDHSGESESEFFESSQDITNTDSEDSSCSANFSPVQQSDSTRPVSWTREEDKIILQAFRQRSDNDETFKHISEALQNRSVVDIKSRFNKLMNLLQQMASHSNS